MANGPTLNLQRGDSVGNGAVRIPVLNNTSSVDAVGTQPRSSAIQIDNQIGNALMGVSRTIDGVIQDNKYQDEIDRRRKVESVRLQNEKINLDASKNASDSLVKLQADFYEQQGQATDGAANFADTIDKRIETHITEATKDADPKYIESYRNKMQGVKQHLMTEAVRFQHEEGLKYEVDNIQTTAQNAAIAVNKDPTLYDMQFNSLSDTINANTKLLPDAKRDMITKARQNLNLAAGQGYIDSHPIQFYNDIKQAGGTFHMPEVGANVTKYSDAVAQAGAKTGVAPEILLAQINAESGGNNNAKSPKGAQGVSQFMPETAKRYNVDVTNPVSSIVGQARYMGDLLNQFNGDYGKALAGYNWGEGNVQKAIDKYGDAWLDHAPKETRDYVAKIMKSTGSNTLHMDVGHEVVPMSLSGQPWYDHADLATQEKLKQYAEVKSNGAYAQAGVGVATQIANNMVSDKPINLDDAMKQTLTTVEANYGPMTPEQKDKVKDATVAAVNRAETNWRRNREGQLVTAYQALDANGGDYAAFVSGNPQLFADMSQKQKDEVNKYAGFVKQGGNVPTDWDTYSDLISNPSYLKAVNLDALKGSMNLRELTTLKTMQKSILDNPAVEDNIVSDHELVKSQLVSAGIVDKKKQAEYYSLLQQGINQELQATGKKKLTQEEIGKINNSLLVKVITDKGFIWDSKSTVAQLKIPDGERAKIVQALNEQRLPATEFNIKRIYANKLTRDNGAVK